jgi:hypothetical protein
MNFLARCGIRPLAVLIAIVAGSERAHSQGDCFRPPAPIESLDNARDHLVLQTRRASYVLPAACITVRRQTFGTVLSFAILNRFPEENATEAYIWIKSDRRLTSSPPVKLSLSRGDGWFLPSVGGQKPAALGRMASDPFAGSIEEWNSAHMSAGSPLDIAARLKVSWHAFATNAPGMPSTASPEFWKIDDSFDRSHGVRTNYLIRFSVNTGDKISTVPFQVYIQREVEQVDLTMFSNIDALSGTYRFLIK